MRSKLGKSYSRFHISRIGQFMSSPEGEFELCWRGCGGCEWLSHCRVDHATLMCLDEPLLSPCQSNPFRILSGHRAYRCFRLLFPWENMVFKVTSYQIGQNNFLFLAQMEVNTAIVLFLRKGLMYSRLAWNSWDWMPALLTSISLGLRSTTPC